MPANDWNIPGSTVEIYQNIFIPAMIGEWVPRLLSLIDSQPGERALDVACGTGALTRLAAEAVGQNGFVAGVDISPDMLNLARKLSDGKFPWIDWRECDAQNLPFADAVFDIVFCELGLMFMPDKVAALKEMQRVLKPGGRLAVMVWGAIDKCPGQMSVAKTWEKLFGAEQAAGFYRQHSVGDPEVVRSLLEKAGFQEIHAQPEMGTMRFPSAEHLVRSYGALGKFPADEIQQAAAIRDVTQALQRYLGAEGLAYPIEAVLARAKRP
jgi:ubiquinone/menaquinone biosynthesis C-methylase UbiE